MIGAELYKFIHVSGSQLGIISPLLRSGEISDCHSGREHWHPVARDVINILQSRTATTTTKHPKTLAVPQVRYPYIASGCFCIKMIESWVVLTEVIWPTTPNMFIMWPFTENICQFFSRKPKNVSTSCLAGYLLSLENSL